MDFGLISAFIMFLLVLGVKAQDTRCEITINQGTLKGTLSKSKKDFCTYTGIPYGEPPLGNLRFKAPRPLKSWEGVFDATKEGNICWQPDNFDKYVGDENCLFINVYTPNLKPSFEPSLPVLFWISPGEFYSENSYRSSYEPDLFIDKDTLLVTFNYRVGAFGFLSTDDDEAPGNYGMKDQILALHWVQDNIKAFGGDPSRVTIAGLSSGAASVHFLMLSPLAKGLFQNAICQEGTAIMPWARHKAPKELAKKQARLVQCPEEPSSALVSCLRNTSALAITKSIYKLFILWIVPSPDFTPVVEKKTERNPEPFLTEDPISIVKNGKFEKVPFLIGGNSQPAILIISAFYNIRILRDQLNVLLRILPEALMMKKSLSNDEVIPLTEKIKNYYGLTDTFSSDKEEQLTMLFSDRYFVHGNHRTVTLHALAGHKSIYFYNFAYRGSYSLTQTTSLKNYGVAHADELRYLFRKKEVSGYDAEISEFMVTLWTNFIKYGDPTSPNASKSEGSYLAERLIWYPVGELSKENMHIQYLNIGQVIDSPLPSTYLNQHLGPVKINMAYDLYPDRMAFWDSLPLEENDGCVKCGASRHLQVSIVTITACLCLWNSIYNI